jgi:hypothetical protein
VVGKRVGHSLSKAGSIQRGPSLQGQHGDGYTVGATGRVVIHGQRHLFNRGHELIATPGDRFDQTLTPPIVAQRLAQRCNPYVERVVCHHAMAPDCLMYIVSMDRVGSMLEQESQQ